jgi:DNA repair exonuclease SbcCD ATPase subunit
MEFKNRFSTLKQDISRLRGQRDQLQTTLSNYEKRYSQIKTEVALLGSSRELYQKGSTTLRLRISERFANLASRALKYIFQRDDIKFIVELDIKSNLPSATFYVEIGGHQMDPKEALGGSIYEIIGVCLRLVCLEVFGLKGPLMLDEPLRSVDETNLKNALEFIHEYCRETNRQLFIVTHNDQIAKSGDKIFEVIQQNGISLISEI